MPLKLYVSINKLQSLAGETPTPQESGNFSGVGILPAPEIEESGNFSGVGILPAPEIEESGNFSGVGILPAPRTK